MIDNRKLLELAAEAAGYWEINGWSVEHEKGMRWVDHDMYWVRYWNPINDDGDAFRLATKLALTIFIDENEVSVYYATGKFVTEKTTSEYDIETTTRRAIVRAAAKIGSEIMDHREY